MAPPPGPGSGSGGGAGSPPGRTSPGRASRPALGGKGRRQGRRCRPGCRRSDGKSWRGPAARGRPAPRCCAKRRSSCRSAGLRAEGAENACF